jgi:tripartite-type tricarboxylate transporter receptor subunit TctC
MTKLSRRAALFGLAFIALPAQLAAGQEQTLKIVFPFAAGGSADGITRIVAERLQKSLGRPVIVENKAGAGGRIGAQAVKDAPADGSTILFAAAPQFTLQPHLSNLGYDPFADFVPISRIVKFDQALAVSGKIPPRSIKDLIAWSKANPDRAAFGSPGAGTAAHFAATVMSKTFDVTLRHVRYRGTPAALPDLLEGRLPIYIASNAELMEHHKSGAIPILATAGSERSPFLPDVPTLKESGVSFEAEGWFAFYAPSRMTPELVESLEKAITGVVQSSDIRDKMRALGFQATNPAAQDLKRIQRAEYETWGAVIKSIGFKPE